jgi:hypothetical protein
MVVLRKRKHVCFLVVRLLMLLGFIVPLVLAPSLVVMLMPLSNRILLLLLRDLLFSTIEDKQ